MKVPSRIAHPLWVERGEEPVTARTKQICRQRLDGYTMPELEPERRAVLEKYVPADMLDV